MKATLKETQVYLDQPYVKVLWSPADNAVYVEWKATPSNEYLKSVLDVQRQIIREHGCMKVCLNSNYPKNNIQIPATN